MQILLFIQPQIVKKIFHFQISRQCAAWSWPDKKQEIFIPFLEKDFVTTVEMIMKLKVSIGSKQIYLLISVVPVFCLEWKLLVITVIWIVEP